VTRRARCILAALVGLAVLAAATVVASRGHAANSLCGRTNAKLVLRHGRAVVVQVRSSIAAGTATYGCFEGLTYRGGQLFFSLGENDPGRDGYGVRTRVFRLAGAYVAYASEAATQEGDHGLLLSRNVMTGRVRFIEAITDPTVRVTALVLRPNGSMAWIEQGPSYAVHAHDSRGSRVLDRGGSIVPASLNVHGSTVTWTHGQFRRVARLR
jgi:hypothetical protein